MESRPSLAILQLHLLALFATGVAMSSWVWTSSTLQAWKRFIVRYCPTISVYYFNLVTFNFVSDKPKSEFKLVAVHNIILYLILTLVFVKKYFANIILFNRLPC